MSDKSHVEGHELASRLAALTAAPDRRDWREVEERSLEQRRGWLGRFTVLRRPAGIVGAGAAMAMLAAVLVALFVLTPSSSAPKGAGLGPDPSLSGPGGVLEDFLDDGAIESCHFRVDYDAARRLGVASQYGDLGGAIDVALAHPALTGTDSAPCPTTRPAFTTIPVTPRQDVPASVARTLGLRADTPIVKLGSFTTPDSTYTIWRARNDAGTFGGRYIDSVQQDGSGSSGGGACVPPSGAVFPEEPPGAPKRVAVPELTGLTVVQARARLRGIGLDLGHVDRSNAPRSRASTPDEFVVTSVLDSTPAPPGAAIDALAVPGGAHKAIVAPAGKTRATAICSGQAGPQGTTVVGGTDAGVEELELRWPSGTSVRVPVSNGAFVASVPDDDCSHFNLPESVLMLDGAGREIGRVDAESIFPHQYGDQVRRFDPPRCRPALGDPRAGFSVLTTGAPVPADAAVANRVPGAALVDWTTARVARNNGPFGSYGTVSLVVTRSRSATPGVCLVAIPTSGRSNWVCPSLKAAASGLAWSIVEGANPKGLPETGPAVMFGLAPDGIVEVRDGPRASGVEGNVWTIFLPNGAKVPTELTFTLIDGTQQTVTVPGA